MTVPSGSLSERRTGLLFERRHHRHPNSVAVLEQVPVNDTRQWVLIRSENVQIRLSSSFTEGPRDVTMGGG